MEYTKATDTGVYRDENQDRAEVFESEALLLAVLCDGMGGHFGGSLAATITIETFRMCFETLPDDAEAAYEWFRDTIKLAKQNMANEAGDDSDKRDMGTTVTAAVVFKNTMEIIIFNIGDSRTYLFNGELRQITIDHNLMNYYIMREHISEFEASKLPGAHALTSALGPSKKTNIEAFKIEAGDLKSGDGKRAWFKRAATDGKSHPLYLILTSDGIHDRLEKPHFEAIISSNDSLRVKAETLIKTAIRNGSTDNLTCIIVDVKFNALPEVT